MTAESGGGSIQSFLQEDRVFPPPAGFASGAHIKSLEHYQELWDRARDDPEGFWAEMAEILSWDRRWDKVFNWSFPPSSGSWVAGSTPPTTASIAIAKGPARTNPP